MYFDPLSAWLVTLIADGIILASEQSQGGTAAEYHRENIIARNRMLNADIRKLREKRGLRLPENTYKQIQCYIRVTKNSFSFQRVNGQIVLDLDNQEYIIAVLEECAKEFSQYTSVEEFRQKAEWYKSAAYEARRRKDIYVKELEERRTREAIKRENDQAMSNIFLVIGLIIVVAFVIFLFS